MIIAFSSPQYPFITFYIITMLLPNVLSSRPHLTCVFKLSYFCIYLYITMLPCKGKRQHCMLAFQRSMVVVTRDSRQQTVMQTQMLYKCFLFVGDICEIPQKMF